MGNDGSTTPNALVHSPTSGIDPEARRPRPEHVFAVVDLGTNSFRMLVTRGREEAGFEILASDKRTVRLGQDVFKESRLTEGAMERALNCLREFKDQIDPFAPWAVRLVGTSALREADNSGEFVDRVEREFGWRIEIIDGTDEARLIAVGIQPLLAKDEEVLLVDIGGGSTELTHVLGGAIRPIRSLGVGAVRLTDLFVRSDPIAPEDFRMMRAFIRNELGKVESELRAAALDRVVGSAGTIKTLLKLAGTDARDLNALYPLQRKDVESSLERLRTMTLRQRIQQAGLSERRAEIIVPGALLLLEILRTIGAEEIHVCGRSLVDGTVLDLISNREHHDSYVNQLAAQNLAEFGWLARRFRIDEGHVRRVHDLAQQILDGLSAVLGYGEDEKRLLGTAALFHDVGRLVEPARHHKHSYYIIRHLPLSGFSTREREIIALVARYHTGTLPKATHTAYSRLSKADRTLVDHLGGILKLANGLDHSRNGRVLRVESTIKPRKINVRVIADGDVGLDLWAASRKTDLLEQAFERKVRIFEELPLGESGD